MADFNIKVNDGYEVLADVLVRALEQAQNGKGLERHATNNQPFHEQQICEITRRVGYGYPTGQAIKKIIEAQRLNKDMALEETLGAINYLAAYYIVRKESD